MEVPIPPPMQRTTYALDERQDVPGEIRLDQSGKLVKSVIEMGGITQFLIDIYNNWIINVLPKQISSRTIHLNQGDVHFERMYTIKPSQSVGGKSVALYPADARNNKLTYAAEILVDLVLHADPSKGRLKEERIEKVSIGKIPVMLGSTLCHLDGKTDIEKIEMGECPRDPMGYFIINGSEKVVVLQEKLRLNRIFISEIDKKGGVQARMTCPTIHGDRVVDVIVGPKKDLQIHLPFLGKAPYPDTSRNMIGVFQIFRLFALKYPNELGSLANPDTMMGIVAQFTKPDRVRRIYQILQPSFLVLDAIGNDLEDINKKRRTQGVAIAELTLQQLENELFPQMVGEPVIRKVEMLAMMIAKLAEYLGGFRELDDRDSWANKRLESAGRAMEQLFNGLWNLVTTKVQDEILKKNNQTLEQVRVKLIGNTITEGFSGSFQSTNWGVPGSYSKENITEMLKRESALATISAMTKVQTPVSRQAKNPRIRMVNMTQLGYLCPAETPEGENCYDVATTEITLANGIDLASHDEVVDQKLLIKSFNPTTNEFEPTSIANPFTYHSGERKKPVYQITLISGRQIRVTGEHPFLTQRGWVPTDDLDVKTDRLMIAPTTKRMSMATEEKVVLTIDQFKQKCEQIKESRVEKYIEELAARQLLPLVSTDRRLPILARIFGFIATDGSIGIYESSPHISMCFGTPTDAEMYCDDLEVLGFARNKIIESFTTITDPTTGRESHHRTYRVQNGSTFAALMVGLGSMLGKKTTQPHLPIPEWIVNGSDAVKREYLSGFQGGDGSAMMWHKRMTKITAGKFNFPRTIQSKEPRFVDSLESFFKEMSQLYAYFGIETLGTTQTKISDDRIQIALNFSNSESNILRYIETIGYRYATTKTNKSWPVAEYLNYKNRQIAKRQARKEEILRLKASGLSNRRIADQMSLTYRQITSVLEYHAINPEAVTLVPPGTLGYDQFLIQNEFDENRGMVKIESIVETEPCVVGDFTTLSDNHSFIANGFITHNCGIQKNLAITCTLSIERDENLIRQAITPFLLSSPASNATTRVLLNGKFLGWCVGEELRAFCLAQRRSARFYRDTLIVLNRDNELMLNTDSSRTVRPLLILDTDGVPVIQKKNLWNSDINEWLREGCVEYIDAMEQEYLYVAQSLGDLGKRDAEIRELMEKVSEYESLGDQQQLEMAKAALTLQQAKPKYTHCEMDPTAILGVAASLIPMADRNQAPRNTYQCSMGKQALGIYHSNQLNRYDTTAKVLAFPTRPLFETQMNSILGLNDLPSGEMIIVAIMTYGGFNQEDSFIFNQGSIDRGMFTMVKYSTHSEIEKVRDNAVTEVFGKPEVRRNESASRYAALGPDGLPMIGAKIKPGDAILGRIRTNVQTKQTENASVFATDPGVIDSVLVSMNAEHNRVVKIRIRTVRIPVIGDKFASRSAQKGTIGLILPEEDMPYTAEGVKPDIIINPHSIPSRMTIGKVIEIVMSKIAALKGERANATAFRPFNVDDLRRNLREYGYNSNGNEIMYSGRTGKRLQAEIYIGPCYYQALRHHVLDKIQQRSQGIKEPLNRQPLGGRSGGQAMRVGEMERDAFIAFGASRVLTERLCDVSDRYRTVWCRNCGTIAESDVQTNTIKCRKCGVAGDYGTASVPYPFILMMRSLAAASINLSVKLTDQSRPAVSKIKLDISDLDEAEALEEAAEGLDLQFETVSDES